MNVPTVLRIVTIGSLVLLVTGCETTESKLKFEPISENQSKIKLVGWPQRSLKFRQGRDLESLYNLVGTDRLDHNSVFIVYIKLGTDFFWNHCEIPIRNDWLLQDRYKGYKFVPGQNLTDKCIGQKFRRIKLNYQGNNCSYIWYNQTDYSTEQGYDGQTSVQYPDLTMVVCGNKRDFQSKHFRIGGNDKATIFITHPDSN